MAHRRLVRRLPWPCTIWDIYTICMQYIVYGQGYLYMLSFYPSTPKIYTYARSIYRISFPISGTYAMETCLFGILSDSLEFTTKCAHARAVVRLRCRRRWCGINTHSRSLFALYHNSYYIYGILYYSIHGTYDAMYTPWRAAIE